MSDWKVRAWTVALSGEEGVRVAYVGVPPGSAVPLSRGPAEKQFASMDEARSWVEEEARLLGVSVEWSKGEHRPTFS